MASRSTERKHLSLITLTLLNSALILVLHYSRMMPPVHGQRYFASTAVFMNEVIKFSLSLSMALYDIATNPKAVETSAAGLFGELTRVVFTGDSWKLAIPAVLYTLHNSLQYVGISNLDATTFQITFQLKILTTALFSVGLLGMSLNLRKWISLVLLMAGVAIVQIQNAATSELQVLSIKDLKDGAAFHSPRTIWDLKALGNAAAGQLSKRSATYEGIDDDFAAVNPQFNATVGLLAVFTACICSSLAGVYFEKILKQSSGSAATSLWVRNVQLSFYSLWPALFIGVMFKDGEHIARAGFFAGYNWVVWTSILLQALGGVVVALVVSYADNIAKNFATSISVLISFLASIVFFDMHLSLSYLVGALLVVAATFVYNAEPAEPSKVPPIKVSDFGTDEQSYFDLETVVTGGKTPLRGEALSTSRPTTPGFDRRRPKSPGLTSM
ncbi:hypothetical protein BAUCODRAFT_121381 [Baudoinia panamericana UAMH 10762]|uniref:Sugar phosphate transporter domain-containing protein n=1 Tax=Baudoinia panamericana (strain UAMH 10762) TaxID=717646 RepID=M2NHL6_BAUPA|nr:uncharacterized protein BAUCODRAFT_121381 [Baudoinia panamericana UAMH 10762]EMC98515.1 hypothetical protein BAUCODRAFT_121381 [Baudoinia panamericana UAMH 10762]